jgi:sulfide dehydrogenase cytochrome subunit
MRRHRHPRADESVGAKVGDAFKLAARAHHAPCRIADLTKEPSVRPQPLALAALLAIAGQASGQQPDPNLARNLAAACANCHGTNGASQGGTPSLGGQAKADLARKMLDYKNGRAQGTIMPQLAKGYTDEQIDLIAGWFAAQKP